MLEPTPDSFNWPDRPSSSDSTPEVKLEQASSGPKTFYVEPSTTTSFPSKPPSVASTAPTIRRHPSTGAQLRRSKQPYSTSPHEARTTRNKYSGDTTKMSSANYPQQQWVKTENGGCSIPSRRVKRQLLILCPRSRQAAGVCF